MNTCTFSVIISLLEIIFLRYFSELAIVCFWRGNTLHTFHLESGCPIFSWTSNRRTETPSIIRAVKPFLVGSQIHLACCASLLYESGSLIYIMNVASCAVVRVIRISYDASAITVLTSGKGGLTGPIISSFVGALAIGCQSGFTLLVGKTFSLKSKALISMCLCKITRDISHFRLGT